MRALFATSLLSTVAATSDTPVEKVIKLLKELQGKVDDEGTDEATTYDKFACWCKDKSEEKSKAVDDGATAVSTNEANLDGYATDRQTASDNIKTAQETISTKQEAIDTAKADWKTYDHKYSIDHADMVEAQHELRDAKKMLSAKPAAGLVQVRAILDKVMSRAMSAPAVNLASVAAKAKTTGDGDDEELGSVNDVIAVIEKLQEEFKTGVEDLEKEHTDKKKEHIGTLQTLTDELATAKESLTTNQKDKADAKKNMAEEQKQLTQNSATLNDDRAYLKDMTQKCDKKATEYHERQTMRAEELSAISSALKTLEEQVKDKDKSRGKKSLLQVSYATLAADDNDADAADDDDDAATSEQEDADNADEQDDDQDQDQDEDAEDAQDDQDDSSLAQVQDEDATYGDDDNTGLGVAQVSQAAGADTDNEDAFVQIRSHKSALRRNREPQKDRLVALLRAKATQLRSQALATLAEQASEDPFAKIKTLIQDLIENLLKQAQDDAEHEGWCNTEMGKAEQKRGYQADHLKELTQGIHKMEARKGKLEAKKDKLTDAVAELGFSLGNATETRAEEKQNNEDAVEEAKEGKKAVQDAIQTLKRYYAKAQNRAQELVQVAAPDDAPPSGGKGAYKGSDESVGIIGMLEVIEDDFDRTETETAEAEKTQAADFAEFKRTTNASLTAKNLALAQAGADLSSTTTKLADDVASLKQHQQLLNAAVVELEKLRPTCVGPTQGESAEDRRQSREEEIGALKQALCILNDPNDSCDSA